MQWYWYIAGVLIVPQLLFLLLAYRNYRYALAKYKKKRGYRPRAALLVPCKGLDEGFERNITFFFLQEYENYLLWFIVADKEDAAYGRLIELAGKLRQRSKALDIRVLVAGHGQSCSQKVHNLLYAYERIPKDVEVLAFADSDICVRRDWLSHLVYPLRQSRNGASTGYRWFVPRRNNMASLALAALNAKVAQLLGNTRFNQAWGGSMAIPVAVFRRLGLEKIWPGTVSDDLSLSTTVKKAGLKVAFVPACLVASYEVSTWGRLFEFGRRQFIITRVTAPATWGFALVSTVYSVVGLWATAGAAVYTVATGQPQKGLFVAVTAAFVLCPLLRAITRQKMAAKLLEHDRKRVKAAAAVDILLFWLWSVLMLVLVLSSAFGRTITWRHIRYKLLGPTETVVLDRQL